VLLDGAFGDSDPQRDLLVGEARRDAADDLTLADRQRIHAVDVRAQPPAGDPAGREAAEQRGRPIHDWTERPRLARGRRG
jgi:hypothetical protein